MLLLDLARSAENEKYSLLTEAPTYGAQFNEVRMKYWKISDEKMFYNQILEASELEVDLALSTIFDYYSKPIIIRKKGGYRKIYSVDKKHMLYRLQETLCTNFLNNIMMADTAYGFLKGFSYLDYLLVHTYIGSDGKYLRLDIKDFFGSISRKMLVDVLGYYFELSETLNREKRAKLIGLVAVILTFNGSIAQGAPSSPTVSNLVFRQLDIRIDRYCSCYGIRYSRYADDLLFSSQDNSVLNKSFIKGISKILSAKGFKINYSKTIRSINYISLGGYVISDSIRLSRKKLSEVNTVLFWTEHNLKDLKMAELNILLKDIYPETTYKFNGKYELCNYLAGNRAFIISVLKITTDEKFIDKANRMTIRIENVLKDLLK